MDNLFDTLRQDYVIRAMIATLLLCISCATMGVYVVLRKMAFLGDALAHTALPGIVLAYFLKWPLFVGALFADILTALGISWLAKREKIKEDTAVGILFSSMFALGLFFLSGKSVRQDLTHMLFGSIINVTTKEITFMAITTLIVISFLTLIGKELAVTSMTPNYARQIGINPDFIRTLILLVLAITVVSSIQLVGVILTSAMLITPAATAGLFTKRIFPMMLLSTVFAITSGIGGLIITCIYNYPPGVVMVLLATLLFLISFSIKSIFKRS
ncbi:MAG: metal ABC transporter permease [Lentisphaeria bacterium]|nr:metal ABC transporter permease [Lentisphaeria bacterium]